MIQYRSRYVFPGCVITALCLLIHGCDRIAGETGMSDPAPPAVSPAGGVELDPDESRYLFDVTEHSLEELQNLLARVDEIAQSKPRGNRPLDIVMILHGPDIRRFTYQNYQENKALVDLAAKLDAFEIIDMKVCETSLPEVGVTREDLPPFIESVPYAPQEKQRLTEEGYIPL